MIIMMKMVAVMMMTMTMMKIALMMMVHDNDGETSLTSKFIPLPTVKPLFLLHLELLSQIKMEIVVYLTCDYSREILYIK